MKQMDKFREALEHYNLIDLGWKVQKFTWLNWLQYESYTKERLDRAVANRPWLDEFGSIGVETLISCKLDHFSILLSIRENLGKEFNKVRLFRYEAKWALEKDGDVPIWLAWQT